MSLNLNLWCFTINDCLQMRQVGRTHCTVLVLTVLSACTHGLSVDLSRLRQLRRPFILDKRNDKMCIGMLTVVTLVLYLKQSRLFHNKVIIIYHVDYFYLQRPTFCIRQNPYIYILHTWSKSPL